MPVILQIISQRSLDDHSLLFDVRITEGYDQINDESDLIREMGEKSFPVKKGIKNTIQVTTDLWQVITNK